MEFVPDYSRYSVDELLEAKEHIDKETYPDRYNEIVRLLNSDTLIEENVSESEVVLEIDKYSTFWPRFGAAFIDGIIFFIVLNLECLIVGVEYDTQDRFLQALNGVQLTVYTILMHGFCGQTIGKMLLGVRVVDHASESKINLKQALRRESVNFGLNICWVGIILFAAASVKSARDVSPEMVFAVVGFGILSAGWALAEFITMLFNNKRRAVHDFIGKTVVVRT